MKYTVKTARNVVNLEKLLNDMGEDGWTFVDMTEDGSHVDRYTVLFSRSDELYEAGSIPLQVLEESAQIAYASKQS